MMVMDLAELARVLQQMQPGERVNLERTGYRTLWPRAPIHAQDDYLEDAERAKRWCAGHGCSIHESFDPSSLVIDKLKPTLGVLSFGFSEWDGATQRPAALPPEVKVP